MVRLLPRYQAAHGKRCFIASWLLVYLLRTLPDQTLFAPMALPVHEVIPTFEFSPTQAGLKVNELVQTAS